MKRFVQLTAVALLAVAGASAAGITINLENAYQTGAPGQTLSFFGTITNTDPVPEDAAIYLNGDSLNLTLSDATLNDQFYANWFPISLAPGQSSGLIDLFDVTLANTEGSPWGPYKGAYGLQGGIDGGDLSAMDPLAQVTFTVDVEPSPEPEPSTLALLGTGLVLVPVVRRRMTTKRRGPR